MKKLLLLVFALLGLVFGAAGALRIYAFGRPIRFRSHERLGWEMVPDQKAFNIRGRSNVHTNRFGRFPCEGSIVRIELNILRYCPPLVRPP